MTSTPTTTETTVKQHQRKASASQQPTTSLPLSKSATPAVTQGPKLNYAQVRFNASWKNIMLMSVQAAGKATTSIASTPDIQPQPSSTTPTTALPAQQASVKPLQTSIEVSTTQPDVAVSPSLPNGTEKPTMPSTGPAVPTGPAAHYGMTHSRNHSNAAINASNYRPPQQQGAAHNAKPSVSGQTPLGSYHSQSSNMPGQTINNNGQNSPFPSQDHTVCLISNVLIIESKRRLYGSPWFDVFPAIGTTCSSVSSSEC
jgi:hypothetical protein